MWIKDKEEMMTVYNEKPFYNALYSRASEAPSQSAPFLLIYEMHRRIVAEPPRNPDERRQSVENLFSMAISQKAHPDFDTMGKYVIAHLALVYAAGEANPKDSLRLLTFLQNTMYGWIDLDLKQVDIKGPENYPSLDQWRYACLAPSRDAQIVAMSFNCHTVDKGILNQRLTGKPIHLIKAFELHEHLHEGLRSVFTKQLT
jgi:hypothetical protein